MKKLGYIGILLVLISCRSTLNTSQNDFNKISIDTLLQGSFSCRAIVFHDNKIYYGADKSSMGYISLTDRNDKGLIVLDTLATEFRSIASNSESVFVLNVGNPAKLYNVSNDLQKNELVYTESHEKVFFDSMQFWNNKEGIALGDPINDCFNIIITRNGGKTWNKINCNALPKLEVGEAAFAASNTNIVVKNNKTWIVSGGKKSRVFYSADKGLTWTVLNTPIIQGQTMTGIFTADFYDETIGIIAGGDYEKPNQNTQNKAVTTNGGQSWQLVNDGQGFGYASCVQFFPKSKGKKLVSVGASGLFYSTDKGQSWKQFSTDKNLYTVRFIDSKTAIAAGKNKIIRITFD